MLRRLFLALLIACLAAPAVAMPVHCAPPAHQQAMAHHGGHHGGTNQAPAPAPAQHDCIGCIAPYAAHPAGPGAPFHGRPPLGEAQTSFHALAPPAPDTPPPRT